MGTTAKIAFSIEPETLQALDNAARRRRTSRSRLIRDAIRQVLREERAEELRARIDAVFEDEVASREQRETAEASLGASALRAGDDEW